MSIKKLFNKNRQGSRNYADYGSEKSTFEEVESARNSQQISIEKSTYSPQVDYSEPSNFVRFGSAELYYSGAMNRIADYYPYDGSDAEKNAFYNNLFDAEKYIFNNLYPRFNGYAAMGAPSLSFDSKTVDGYGRPSSGYEEHIAFTGGPNSGSGGTLATMLPNPYNNKHQASNIYDEAIYTTAGLPTDYGKGTRESNLKSNFDTGTTVEFWLKKPAFDTSATEREVILDVWNNELTSSDSYGRITIELDGTTGASPFLVTVQSGTLSASVFALEIGNNVTTTTIQNWGHYAFRFYNDSQLDAFVSKLYVNGNLNDTKGAPKMGEITTKAMLGRIGALVTSPSASTAVAGDGTLSASIDDFRFWKSDRNSRQISLNYFVNVGGGSNTDISNASLGVYYKFNEGLTNTSSIDNVVLDYAGRVTNGLWTGYGSYSRNTGSAIVLAGAAEKEYREPVVRKNNSDFINLKSGLRESGSYYDSNNNAAFVNYMPAWVLDDHDNTDNKNLRIISHMAGMYFDKMYLMASELPKFKHLNYTTASSAPLPFASHLPTSMGLYVPDLFVDATILERLLDRTDKELFESKLDDVKNLIYLNLYNNLTSIYKSKGTEKAIRNVFRCFNLDDKLIKLNTYNKNATYEIKTNLKQEIVEKNTIEFNSAANIGAVIYQAKNTTNQESSGFITGTYGDPLYGSTGPEEYHGATIEADILFPRFFLGSKDKFDRKFKEVSLFGAHMVDGESGDSLDGTDTTLLSTDVANFQVYAIRDKEYSSNVYFKLTSSVSPFPIPELTSSTFIDVYDNTHWNFSVRVKPKDFPNAGRVSGSLNNTYDVIFRGVNNQLGTILNSFELSTTITNTSGSSFLRAPKRIYVGARRQNITGAILQNNDTQILSTRYWTKYIDNHSLNMHAFGDENSGISDSHLNMSPIDSYLTNPTDITNKNTLALSWTFDNVTASNATGNFTVQDYSSGSVMLRDNYSWVGKIAGYQHSGYGYGFAASSDKVSVTERINAFNFVDPEQTVASDMINIRSEDDEVMDIAETIPNYVFTIEKSMYQSISAEMVNFFAGAVDFNNIIGDPVNRYRQNYKTLEKLRQSFYERVTTVADVEKYIDYYKWFDDALSTIISQLVPASADFTNDVMNMIESHVLERNKYETKFPTLEARDPEPEGPTFAIVEKLYPSALGSSPVPSSPRDTTIHTFYWKHRAERTHPDISSGNPIIDGQRETYRKVINTNPHMSRSLSNLFDASTADNYTIDKYSKRNFIKSFTNNVKVTEIIKGGVNFEKSKNIHFAYSSLRPAGPINTEGGKIVPENVLLSLVKPDLVEIPTNNDPKLIAYANDLSSSYPTEKVKRFAKVQSGRDFEQGLGYKNLKSSVAFPFNLFSSSVITGYQKEITERLSSSITITNLHNDVYGDDMEVPMQGPFTEYAVGGHQSRHVKLNVSSSVRELDDWLSRPEAWKILLGTCEAYPEASGAIGMVGPDYPNPADYLTPRPYPDTRQQKAVHYRDHVAKRPVNIRNILMTTGSTILGNYRKTYQYVQTAGAFLNPRHLVDNQPDVPPQMFSNNATSSMVARTFLDLHRTARNHTQNMPEYSTGYLTGAKNQSVIITRFSHGGAIEVSTRGYLDIRGSEFSAYNALNYRNLTVLKPSQGPSGSISEPITNGDTTNIQVYDIHAKDYGLRSHLARHTARFGRDSLHESAPGTSYEELPGFHKVHRNNLTRKEVCGYTLVPQLSTGSEMANAGGFMYDPNANVGPSIGYADTASTELIDSVRNPAEGFSWTGWVKFGHQNNNVEENIVFLGSYGINKPAGLQRGLLRIYKVCSAGSWSIKAELATQSGSVNTTSGSSIVWQYQAPTELTSAWGHYGVTWTPPTTGELHKASNHNNLTIYHNGISQSATIDANDNYSYYDTDTSTVSNWKNFGGLNLGGDKFMCLGGDGGVATATLSASIDEYTFWKKPLTSTQVSEIYNGGVPCDITASATYSDGELWDWLRFEVSGGSSQISIKHTNPGVLLTSNRIIGFLNTFQGVPITAQGQNNNSREISDVPTGCSRYIEAHTEVPTYCDKNIYDNFYVQHPIPRSTKQYAWITASIEVDHKWVGYAPKDWYVTKADLGIDIGISPAASKEYVPCYAMVSASDYGSYMHYASGRRYFGSNYAETSGDSARGDLIKTDFVGLNTTIYEPISSSDNTLGYPTDIRVAEFVASQIGYHHFKPYLNPTIIYAAADNSVPHLGAPAIFNALMLNRNGPYGWPSWKPLRMAEHPITRNERKNNVFSTVSEENDGTFKTYNLPPVSNRGRPDMINMYAFHPAKYTITFRTTGENEEIYFNNKETNDRFAPQLYDFITPTQQMLRIIPKDPSKGRVLNWVAYSQQIFPSIRNEFVSHSYGKPTYDNLYWKDNREQRNSINTVYNRYGAATASNDGHTVMNGLSTENSFGIYVSQSAWPLDAPVDFLTRATPFEQEAYIDGDTIPRIAGYPTARYASCSAGELQNVYMAFATGAINTMVVDPSRGGEFNFRDATQFYFGGQLAIGSLYARKHALDGAPSVKSPYGPSLPYTDLTGALTPLIISSSLCTSSAEKPAVVGMGAGEALWEAPRLAGYVTRSSNNVDEWVSAPSKPWADSYEDFRYHIKLSAKGYSILPEFRISEHMDEYLENDNSFTGFNDLNLEIPHVTGANSKQDEDFYISYSNSEFLRDFLKIRSQALLAATQIRVACTGAIKFNPYKGFYPAQRTIQLAEAFKDSYINNMLVNVSYGTTTTTFQPGNKLYTEFGEDVQVLSPNTGSSPQTPANPHQGVSYGLRPMINTLFSPGILYNSIKSGIAVDYPIVTDANKMRRFDHGRKADTDPQATGSWAMGMLSGSAINSLDYTKNNNQKWSFFGERLPFETMIEPEKYLEGKPFFDMESNPFYGIAPYSASFIANQSKKNYNLMARNFFGSIPSFFLQNEEFTNIKSALSEGTKTFKSGSTFMMRVKLERSSKGARTYEFERDGNYASTTAEDDNGYKISLYSKYGGIPISAMATTDEHGTRPCFQTGAALAGQPAGQGSAYFPLPQDPIFNPEFKETFTMYSRPTAFGPPLSGRIPNTRNTAILFSGAMDSFSGINPAYTPPYYNGEAWCDVIFRPDSAKEYTLEDIMQESDTYYWRFDAGSRITSSEGSTLPYRQAFGSLATIAQSKALIPDIVTDSDGQISEYGFSPLGGAMINDSSMQMSASFNIFGIQKENFVEVDKFGNIDATRPGTKIGSRWVIRSKFETPMLNFSDIGIHPISGANITFPENYGGASTPRGMWHQFGSIPTGSTGVHLSVNDVPKNWLKNHYMTKDFRSIYNNNEPSISVADQVQSLADLVGFKNDKTKLGVLKEQHTIREAVVAIPYIIEKSENDKKVPGIGALSHTKKSFIQIPSQRYAAATTEAFGSVTGDSFEAAGPSISKQLQKMQRYVFPPQLDFINNPAGAVDPFVMYIFEFKYELDKNDLSYIWQNLAPRDFDKFTYQTESTAHELMDTELLNESILLENEQLRWMVFKVKQKAQDDYWSKTDEQISSNNANTYGQSDLKGLTKDGLPQYELAYNWPYDYVSIVEMVKVNCDILYNRELNPWEIPGNVETMGGEGPEGGWVPGGGPDGDRDQNFNFDFGIQGGWQPPIGSTASDDDDGEKKDYTTLPERSDQEIFWDVNNPHGGNYGGGSGGGGGGHGGPGDKPTVVIKKSPKAGKKNPGAVVVVTVNKSTATPGTTGPKRTTNTTSKNLTRKMSKKKKY